MYARENTFLTRNVKKESYGKETLAHIGPKIWSIVPNDMKNFSLSIFSKRIRRWKPEKCPCRLCKTFIQGVGFVDVVNYNMGYGIPLSQEITRNVKTVS